MVMVNDAQLPSPSWPCCLSAPSPRLHFIGAMVVIESRKERRSAAKLARFGHVPRHHCCYPTCGGGGRQAAHTAQSAAVPAVSPRLCFLGTVAVDRGRRVIAQNGCLMANNVAGGIACFDAKGHIYRIYTW